MDTAEKLKYVRSKLDLSQEEFATQIGVSQSTIKHIEIGRTKNISFKISQKSKEIFGIDTNFWTTEDYSDPFKNNEQNKSIQTIDINNTSFDNNANNVCSDSIGFEGGKNMDTVLNQLSQVFMILGELRAEIKQLKQDNKELKDELQKIK